MFTMLKHRHQFRWDSFCTHHLKKKKLELNSVKKTSLGNEYGINTNTLWLGCNDESSSHES